SHYVAAAILALFAVVAWLPAVGPRPVTRRAWVGINTAIFCTWLPWLVALGLHWLNNPLPRVTLAHRVTPDEVVGALVPFSSGSSALLTDRSLLQAGGLVAGAGLLAAAWQAGRDGGRASTRWVLPGALRALLAISAAIFFLPAVVSMLSGLWLFVPHFM